jgi:hypothetical protein
VAGEALHPRTFAANQTKSSHQPHEPRAEPIPGTSQQQPKAAHDINANHTNAPDVPAATTPAQRVFAVLRVDGSPKIVQLRVGRAGSHWLMTCMRLAAATGLGM